MSGATVHQRHDAAPAPAGLPPAPAGAPAVAGAPAGRRQAWLDVRSAGADLSALCQAAIHHGFDAIVSADPADLEPLPPTIRRVLLVGQADPPQDVGVADVVLVDVTAHPDPDRLTRRYPERATGRFVEVSDARTLATACDSARRCGWTVLQFRDPTNIPLEIVLAAAADAAGTVVSVVERAADAPVHLGVLEHGPDGIMIGATSPAEVGRLAAAVRAASPEVALATLTVDAVRRVGMGDRACVDTCTYLRPDEGLLVGSWASGLVLCVSETHPLPYMPTRPFRVNAGAIMSYTLADHTHTRYLSELRAGDSVLAVGADGRTRAVTVGRIKIERRPLLSVTAVAGDGQRVNVIVQDDWHVRILGPAAAVLNSTELTSGDRILGMLPGRARHVGHPIDEMCLEQ
ncbi:3-dehydroquinate synthase II family protein [Solwaraspora sp. WMMB335]|uniref:3-dehydroquinate synthase II family protein n=1 Tax=Solwaraspora sp. WMMB335 TaxID=3404118 RepID=UPI003B9428BC